MARIVISLTTSSVLILGSTTVSLALILAPIGDAGAAQDDNAQDDNAETRSETEAPREEPANQKTAEAEASDRTPADVLMPNSAKAFVVVHNPQRFQEKVAKTNFGRIFEQEELEPFLEELTAELQLALLADDPEVGISYDDVQGIVTGEVAMGVLLPADDEHAAVLIADVKGNEEAAGALLDDVEAELTRRGAEALEDLDVDGTNVKAYELPLPRGEVIVKRSYFTITGGYVVATNHAEVAIDLVKAITGEAAEGRLSLKDVEAYQQVQARLDEIKAPTQPEAKWFVEPFGLARAIRNTIPPDEQQFQYMNILQRQGFDAIEGLGGDVSINEGDFEILHRTYILAPGAMGAEGEVEFDLAAKSLQFNNSDVEALSPQPFVPPTSATYLSFNWDMLRAFKNVGGLVDEIVGSQGAFDRMLVEMEEAGDGPQVDLQNELVRHFQPRLTVISNVTRPITTDSQQLLVAIPIGDVEAVGEAVAKIMRIEPGVVEREFGEYQVWVKDPSAFENDADNELDWSPFGQEEGVEQEEEESLAGWNSFTVAHGYLFIANDVDWVVEVLAQMNEEESLATTEAFQTVAQSLNAVVDNQASFVRFGWGEESLRVNYELLRKGEMPQSQSLMGTLLNRRFGPDEPGVPREQRIDPNSLPADEESFDRLIAPHLGPSGWAVRTEEGGWLIVGGLFGPMPKPAHEEAEAEVKLEAAGDSADSIRQ